VASGQQVDSGTSGVHGRSAPQRAAAILPSASKSGAPILIVDDNPGKRTAIASIVRPLGHEVIEAESGEAALKAVLASTFAVILLDVQMPLMGGYETARLIRMRKQSEHTPIIFVTAYARDEAQIPDAYASGAVDFMFAPLVPDILRAKVSVFTELALKSRELEQSLHEVTVLSERFRDSEARTRAVLENVADGIVTVTDEGLIESFNRAASVLFGYDELETVGRSFDLLIAPAQRGDFSPSQLHGRQPPPLNLKLVRIGELLGCRKDGSTFPMELDFSDLRLDAGNIHVACLRDVSERRSHTEALEREALHDSLTGLPNRVMFGDRVSHAIRLALRSGATLGLLLLDLDGFKRVNDTLGHEIGDDLLRGVADRLCACLRKGDTVARLGGDEFGILTPATGLAGAATVAWKLRHALEEPFVFGEHVVSVSASIGMTLIPEHGDNIDDLLRRADLAMYDAKGSGRGYALFAAEHEDAPARRLALLRDLRRCVERNELVLHYQPKIDLATRRTVGVEALIRWNHPSGRLMMPDEFMPEVESNELMLPITDWVIEEALRALRGWREQGYDLTMAVNVGARCLVQDTGFFERVDGLMAASGIPPEQLTLELTESAFIDTELPGLLARLEDVAPRLSIDDFGTGYSSLVYLQRLPVVELKADRSFVSTVPTVESDARLVRSIVELAHNLGVTVVAEGVEDQATLERLVDYGCDVAQGYYFSRAIPAGDLTAWLESSEFGLSGQGATVPVDGVAA
jgi:diguanylate cyclase (GGDEF)-like protein/PAS domain S-box-containing protein